MARPLAAILVILAALASSAQAAEPIIIGAYLPMTGNVAAYGQMGWSGITVAKKMEPTVLDRPIEVKLVDTKSDKVEAANAVSRLIEKEKVVAIIGDMISGNTIAGAENAERHKVPMVSPTATNPIVTQGKEFIFRVCFIDPDQGRVAAKLALDQLKAKTAAVIYDISQDYSVALTTYFTKDFTEGGGKIVAATRFKSGDRDFTPQVSSIKGANPDIIYAPIYYTECALIAKQAKEMGLNVPILAGDGVQAPELIQLGGKAVENVYFTAHFHKAMISTERGKKFQELFEKDTGKELDAFSAMSADAYFIIVDAIKRAGTPEPKKIRDALASTKDFGGVTGKITLKPDGNPIKSMVINKVEDGNFVYVTTVTP
ncbi:MAG TPA: ABC transporter substrate-binding protein [Desulfomonilaceae bacterium]|nr:ABC transporter substrate-binding protein [Desulfomonilaceae bacterium]